MVKKLANKLTKKLMTDQEIRKESLNKSSFTDNWQGRIFISKPEQSFIAAQMGIKEKGEYAIKVK